MSCDWIALANSGVQKLQPYQPGKPIEALQRELGIDDIIKLASNENPLGPPAVALQAARQAAADIHRYPDGSGFRLKQVLSRHLDLNENRITLGNGSNDVLELIARAYLRPGDEVVFSEHAFAVYPLVTLACSAIPVVAPAINFGHDLEAMLEAITERTRLVFIANPNNPTGTWITVGQLDHFLDQVPDHVLVVLDEAYFEYVEAEGYPNGLDRLVAWPNLVVTRTFSKIHALAGLRVGYSLSHPDVADVLNRVRQPFNCNAMALAAAEAALSADEHVELSREVNAAGLGQLGEGFSRLGLDFIPSVGNFIALDCGRTAQPLYQALLQEGVIVRPIDAYGMPHHLRVTVGLATENERFLRALKKVLS